MRRRFFLQSFLSAAALLVWPQHAFASRDDVAVIFKRCMQGLFNWTPSSIEKEIARALADFTKDGRINVINALEASGLLKAGKEHQVSCQSTFLTALTVQEGLSENGLLRWQVSAPLRIKLTRSNQTLIEKNVNISTRLILVGAVGSASIRISQLWLNPLQGVEGA